MNRDWYGDWQDGEHAQQLDGRAALPDRSLIRNFERFSDVPLLGERLQALPDPRVLEVGCGTGEFYRYLRLKHPRMSYAGFDIARPAILSARRKYPQGRFFASDPAHTVSETLEASGLDPQWPVVYSKDVVHHQTDPFGFLAQLIEVCSDSLIFRTRTRDKGPTLVDPDRSCQYHYQGWMPFIVLNIDEIIDQIRRRAPDSEIVIYRNHMVLGGKENRFLPKECYLPETGTAETAVGIFRKSPRRDRVHLVDRTEAQCPSVPLPDRIHLLLRRRWP